CWSAPRVGRPAGACPALAGLPAGHPGPDPARRLPLALPADAGGRQGTGPRLPHRDRALARPRGDAVPELPGGGVPASRWLPGLGVPAVQWEAVEPARGVARGLRDGPADRSPGPPDGPPPRAPSAGAASAGRSSPESARPLATRSGHGAPRILTSLAQAASPGGGATTPARPGPA